MIRSALTAACCALLVACSGVEVDDYRDFSPSLQPAEFFSGELTAHGVVKNRGGKVLRTFNAQIKGEWHGGVGTLVEDFTFNDGETQRRIWILTPDGNGAYSGTAGDVVGDARMKLAGNSLFLDYVLRIPYGDGTVDVKVDDRMYLTSPTVLVNESSLSKFGWRVGSIVLVIVRRPQPDG